MKNWKLTELNFIRKHLHLTDRQLAAHFGVTAAALQATRKRHGIQRPRHQWNWQKGNSPWNKGVSYNAGGRSVATRFQKGQQPPTAFRKIGDVFTIVDGTGKPYRFIKTEHHRQYPYGRYVWEQATGETLTKEEIIRFRDGNPLNCAFENLQKVSRRENALMNANRVKAAQSLKKVWAVVHAFQDYGLTPPYKFKAKKTKAA